MFNLKLLFQCCCDHNAGAEEEKLGKPSKSPIIDSKIPVKARPYSLDLLMESKVSEDPSRIAAPSPIAQIESMAYPRLQLKITESSVIEIGTILNINATGMEESKRGRADYKTYIGSQFTENGEIINDFVVEEGSMGMGKRHLVIKFHVSSCKYTISDLGDGTGTFAKVGSELILRESYIISFGNSHMKIMSTGCPSSMDKKIAIKFLEGPKSGEEYTFQPSEDTILIGRMGDCKIRFDDSNLSRYQCNISFNQTKGWILKDGVGDKKSTNGTWLYVEDEFEVYDKLVFKAGKTLFEATLD